MSEHAVRFVTYLKGLAARDRGAMAALRRSLGRPPGSDPAVYPVVERFVPDGHDLDARRRALYLIAGLFALHPVQADGVSLARAFGRLMLQRQSDSVEKRFIALLSVDDDQLPNFLRQAVTLLAADHIGLDYAALLDDAGVWMRPWASEARDRVRQRWARDFYRAVAVAAEDESASAD